MAQESSSKKEIKDTFGWALLELIVVPISLALLSYILNENISNRERMKEYLKDITELASKQKEPGDRLSSEQKKLGDYPILRSLARARTLTILRQSNEQSKREIIEFLANSDLQYQISLEKADLHNTDLRGLYLKDADLEKADLRGADLRGAQLQGVNLRGVVLDNNTKFGNNQYDRCTKYDKDNKKIDSSKDTWKEEVRKNPKENPKEQCPYERKDEKNAAS